jgi:hypothetical protein
VEEEEARLLFEAGERGRFVGIVEAEVETVTLLFEREEEIEVRRWGIMSVKEGTAISFVGGGRREERGDGGVG